MTDAPLPEEVSQTEINRLFWQSRRGMLELDVLLVPFTREVYATLTEDNRERYRKLLQCEDADMYQWFMRQSRPDDPDLALIVDLILERVQPG